MLFIAIVTIPNLVAALGTITYLARPVQVRSASLRPVVSDV